ncbi:MAG: EthD family reductase [Candidatus Promineifilaceae bacterium]|nr:EthD family reductase [Candidatus Promineifilaceae bacterium]
MFQFTTIYYRVDDEETLEKFFSKTHLQLAEKLPGLVKSELNRILGQPLGESRYHLAYSLYFATEHSFYLSLASEPGIALMQALTPWVEAKLITWYFADSFEEFVEKRSQAVDLTPN